MPAIEDALRTLRDVQGVYGSFLIAGNGGLVARDLPAAFDVDLFAEVGPRVTRLFETLVSGGDEMDACMLRYSEHKIYLRKMTWGHIGIISAVNVNLPALRMVANLVIRRIDPEVVPEAMPALRPTLPSAGVAPLTTVSSPRPASPAPLVNVAPEPIDTPPPPPSAKPASTGHVRMYRGRPVVDD